MIEGEVVEIEIDKPVHGTASKTVRAAAGPCTCSKLHDLSCSALHRPCTAQFTDVCALGLAT